MIRKIVISPTNTKATAFFDELNKKKEDIKNKLKDRPFPAHTKDKNSKIGK